MSTSDAKPPEENRLVSKEELKIEDTKILRRIDELRQDLTAEIQALKAAFRDVHQEKMKSEESNAEILRELAQISTLLQKLNQEQEYTRRVIQSHEKSLEEYRLLIHRIEDELQKIKSILRVD
ncbi:MAG TPA: hypothetical protein ENJ23_00305 [Bacteroidetes bacterium]|nr:hypothetical protein [Bacteroidota bacterium]